MHVRVCACRYRQLLTDDQTYREILSFPILLVQDQFQSQNSDSFAMDVARKKTTHLWWIHDFHLRY